MEQLMQSKASATATTRTAGEESVFARAARLAAGDGVFAKAERLAAGNDVMTRAVATMNAGGGGSFAEAVRILNETSGGARPIPIERASHGTLAGAPAAAPAGTPPLKAPTPSASAAQDLLNKCADAAEKVHGTGKYART